MGERRGTFRIRDRFTNIDAFHTRNRKNVARPSDGLIHALQSFEGIELRDFRLLKGAVELCDSNLVADVERPVKHACDGETAKVIAIVEVRDENL